MLAVAQPPPCVPAGADIVLVRGDAAVFATASNYEACLDSRAPVVLGGRLPTPGMFRRVSTFRLAGHDVAFVVYHDSSLGSPARIKVVDLRDGREASGARASKGTPAARTDEVTSLVLRRDAATAWIVRSSSLVSTAAPVRQVDAARRGAPPRLLDTGAAIALHSLRLHGRRISWRHGAQRRSARL